MKEGGPHRNVVLDDGIRRNPSARRILLARANALAPRRYGTAVPVHCGRSPNRSDYRFSQAREPDLRCSVKPVLSYVPRRSWKGC